MKERNFDITSDDPWPKVEFGHRGDGEIVVWWGREYF